MTTAPVKSLIDEQLDEVEHRIAILGFGLPFNELIGRKREDLVRDLPQRLAPTMKGGRIAVRIRPLQPASATSACSSGTAPFLPSHSSPS